MINSQMQVKMQAQDQTYLDKGLRLRPKPFTGDRGRPT